MARANSRVYNKDSCSLLIMSYSACDTFELVPTRIITLDPDQDVWVHALPDFRGLKLKLQFVGDENRNTALEVQQLGWQQPEWGEKRCVDALKVLKLANGTSLTVRRLTAPVIQVNQDVPVPLALRLDYGASQASERLQIILQGCWCDEDKKVVELINKYFLPSRMYDWNRTSRVTAVDFEVEMYQDNQLIRTVKLHMDVDAPRCTDLDRRFHYGYSYHVDDRSVVSGQVYLSQIPPHYRHDGHGELVRELTSPGEVDGEGTTRYRYSGSKLMCPVCSLCAGKGSFSSVHSLGKRQKLGSLKHNVPANLC